MAEKQSSQDNEFKGFPMGRGRGVHFGGLNANTFTSEYGSDSAGGLQGYVSDGRGRGHSVSPSWSPSEQFLRDDAHTSTPMSDSIAIQHLTDMMSRLGEQIGNSIVAQLYSSGFTDRTHAPDTPMADKPTSVDTTQQNTTDPIQQNTTPVVVHVKTEREPVTFRGNSSDKYSVQEWIAMTKANLRKQPYTTAEKADEIQGRLLGKARDVVKVALRSDDTLDAKQNPDIIYDILMRYFSQSSSSLPLQDFYTTLPKPKENPVDYWIRLNKAADTADEGLRRLGRRMENISGEVAQMFAKHCPDPQLSSIFKCKPVSEWSSKDIQLRIDEYQRESGVSAMSYSVPQLKTYPTAVLDSDSYICPHSDSDETNPQSACPPYAAPDLCTGFTCVQQHVQRPQRNPPQHVQRPLQHPSPHVQRPQRSPPQPVQRPQPVSPPQNAQQTDSDVLGRMMNMLERVLARVEPRSPARTQRRSSPFSSPPCNVCGGPDHSTLSHCKSDHLCFKCLAPDHSKQHCPNNAPPHLSPAPGN